MATCPHCSADNEAGAVFCARCGKALPSEVPSGPRVVSGNQTATTAVGQNLQADQLHKQAKQAFGALLAVSILAIIGGFVFFFILKHAGKEHASAAMAVLITNLILAAIYAGLAFWARVNPLPAAIVGLVLFITIHAVNTVLDPTSLVQGIVIKVVIVVVLVKAIQAGTRYKKLRDQMASQSL